MRQKFGDSVSNKNLQDKTELPPKSQEPTPQVKVIWHKIIVIPWLTDQQAPLSQDSAETLKNLPEDTSPAQLNQLMPSKTSSILGCWDLNHTERMLPN